MTNLTQFCEDWCVGVGGSFNQFDNPAFPGAFNNPAACGDKKGSF